MPGPSALFPPRSTLSTLLLVLCPLYSVLQWTNDSNFSEASYKALHLGWEIQYEYRFILAS